MADGTAPAVILEKVGPENLAELGIGCLTNPKHEGFGPKVEWLKERFEEGLRFFLFRDENKKPLAFLEMVPGEHAWRPVDARGWMLVGCLWPERSSSSRSMEDPEVAGGRNGSPDRRSWWEHIV